MVKRYTIQGLHRVCKEMILLLRDAIVKYSAERLMTNCLHFEIVFMKLYPDFFGIRI